MPNIQITTVNAISLAIRLRRRVLRDESGQILPWMALLMMFLFLGLAALSLDVGHGIFIQRQLQASADAAALAGAQGLPNNYRTPAQNYGDKGFNSYGPGVTFSTPVVNGLCLKSIEAAPFNSPCSSTVPNAVQVTETATFTPAFAGIFGSHKMTISATSTAAGQAGRWNIAIVLDTTPSMGFSDPNCGGATQLACAEGGISKLLAGLDPNTDYVSLFTFPAIDASASSVNADITCNGGSPTVAPYVFPSTTATSYTNTSTPYVTGSGTNQHTTYVTYQLTPFSNSYQTPNDAAQIAIGNGTNSRGRSCGGIQTSMEYTYLAGAIFAAQGALLAQQANLASAGYSSQNALIVLSDGNATGQENNAGGSFQPLSNDFLSTSAQVGGGSNLYASASPQGVSGGYPSWVGQCGQEVDAAQKINSLTTNSTRVYTIAYGSPTSSTKSGAPLGNCETDVGAGQHPGITPCQAMQQMSSGYVSTSQDPYFFSDNTGGTGCSAMPGNNALNDMASIFTAIRGSLTYARLIPNNTN